MVLNVLKIDRLDIFIETHFLGQFETHWPHQDHVVIIRNDDHGINEIDLHYIYLWTTHQRIYSGIIVLYPGIPGNPYKYPYCVTTLINTQVTICRLIHIFYELAHNYLRIANRVTERTINGPLILWLFMVRGPVYRQQWKYRWMLCVLYR